MTAPAAALILAAHRITEALQNETALARLGALGDLTAAAEAKQAALSQFVAACVSRGQMPKASSLERHELRRLLAAADENSLILEAVSSTIGDLARNLRAAAATLADPGTYNLAFRSGRPTDRHVLAARINATV